MVSCCRCAGLSRIGRVTLLGIIMIIFMFGYQQPTKVPPLLLNSGLTGVSEADVQVIFWLPNRNHASQAKALEDLKLPYNGWQWETTASNNTLTVSGFYHLQAAEEAELWAWFNRVAQKAEDLGGKAYFDERVPTSIDVESYFLQNHFATKQAVISGTTVSVAGWQKGFFPEVTAGQDSVNIQLLTRRTPQGSNTVLAVPVLLEEF